MKYSHTALSVASIEKSRKFYETVFGLTFKTQGERRELGVKFITLEDKNSGTAIEFFEHKTPTHLQDDLMDFQKVGLKHIAFVVDNIENVIELVATNGGKVIWPPQKGVTVKRVAFIADPDGMPIELVELLM